MALDQPAIADYASINFGAGSEAWRDLQQAAQQEALNRHIKLSDHAGPDPANLTPEMLTWYRIWVQGPRKAALDAVQAQFSAMSGKHRISGVFVERQLGAIEDKRLEDKRNAYAAHMQKNAARAKDLEQARNAEEAAHVRYENLEARHNRAPKIVPWWYVPALCLLLPAEGGINFETFLAVEWMTPAYSLGTVVILGVLLALSSHLHGTLLRQARVVFDPSQEDIDRLVGWRMLGMGTLGLSVVLGVVAYARNAYLEEALRTAEILGGDAPNAFLMVGGSLLGNIAVWVGGVLLAFLVHDPDPNFPEALKDWKIKAHKALQLQEALERPLQREFERIDAIAKREREKVENHHNTLSHLEDYQQARRQFDVVAKQDAHVLALLTKYRGELVRAVDGGREIIFEKPRESFGEKAGSLVNSQYAAEPLRLKYL